MPGPRAMLVVPLSLALWVAACFALAPWGPSALPTLGLAQTLAPRVVAVAMPAQAPGDTSFFDRLNSRSHNIHVTLSKSQMQNLERLKQEIAILENDGHSGHHRVAGIG